MAINGRVAGDDLMTDDVSRFNWKIGLLLYNRFAHKKLGKYGVFCTASMDIILKYHD